MNFEFYNPTNEKGSCIIRTFAKLLDKDINIIKEELNNLTTELNYDNYKEIEVFEKYFEINGYKKEITKDEMLVNIEYEVIGDKKEIIVFEDKESLDEFLMNREVEVISDDNEIEKLLDNKVDDIEEDLLEKWIIEKEN